MKNPNKEGKYDCPQCPSRKKHPYPKSRYDQPCAECIKKHYNLK